ncbi:MAG: hypothetical protein ABR507_01820 [Actinomycetota bacterium]|nr:hypothetical protein [Actinomycetota bacterium]
MPDPSIPDPSTGGTGDRSVGSHRSRGYPVMLIAVVCASAAAASIGTSVIGAFLGRALGSAGSGLVLGAIIGGCVGIAFGTWMTPKIAGVVITRSRFRSSLAGGLVGLVAGIGVSTFHLIAFIPGFSILLVGFGAALGDAIAYKRAIDASSA